MQQIKNIIFDLGGVLLNIDYNKTSKAFRDLGFGDFDNMFSQFTANHLFEDLETGKIEDGDFLNRLVSIAPAGVTAGQLETAWNAMLLDFRTESLQFLETCSRKYKLFLLSNTNSIHLRAFGELFTRETGKPSLDQYFSKTYYSNLIGLRKPYTATYQYVLADAGIDAATTLFIDDSINNIEGARLAGLQTKHLLPEQRIETLGL